VGTRCGAARRAAAQVGERATLAHTAFKIVVDRLRRTLRARLAMHRSRRPEGDFVCTLYTDHEGKRRGRPVWIAWEEPNVEVWLKKKGSAPKRIA